MVKNKQLYFADGGWSSDDEACVTANDHVNNYQNGLLWLNDHLNYTVDVGWHIDPFGHSAATSKMFKYTGFKGWFAARIDHQDKSKRIRNKEMEMIWRP